MHTTMAIFRSQLFDAVLAVCVVAAAWAYVHWRRSLSDGWTSPRGKPWWTFGALAAVVLVTGFFTYRHDQLEQRLSRAAGGLVGAPVAVHCQGVGGALVDASAELGFVRFGPDGVPEHATLIRYEQCQALEAYLNHHGRHPSHDEIVAVHVLTHESMHMRGETNEAVTECQAVQRDARTARSLGATASDAAALAAAYWRLDYPHMPDDYRTADCAPGGALDEQLDGGWPAAAQP